MRPEALVEFLDRLAQDGASGHGSGSRLVGASVEVIDVTGAGIMLMARDEPQAAGMLSVQLDIPIAAAQSRLRAAAYATSRPIAEVAEAVVDGFVRVEHLAHVRQVVF